MSLYLISYDLHAPKRDYSSLYKTIPTIGQTYKVLESVYLISTNHSSDKVRDILRAHLDSNDEIFVIGINKDFAAYVSKAESLQTWINNH
ncbi:hypothetical protein A8709_33050 [Paenibacillus pectinilyticus]|uniref:Uncharacterized protein n=1 Tax=Paenibacillus pectinilyticus TaxID=512399 RepID=A0A1C0ZX26_9BACL|nr:hypothetical protein A8709_33050 [Paenibacillus pectinilyticus]